MKLFFILFYLIFCDYDSDSNDDSDNELEENLIINKIVTNFLRHRKIRSWIILIINFNWWYSKLHLMNGGLKIIELTSYRPLNYY